MDPKDILTNLQKKFLDIFFKKYKESQLFFLTGGTALAAYYYEHRLSDDLDLFTLDEDVMKLIEGIFKDIVKELDVSIELARVLTNFNQFIVKSNRGESLKVDFVRDVGPQFGEKKIANGIIVDSIDNIGANKLCAILGRTEAKDFIDLYFILKDGVSFDFLFKLAKEKDLGMNEFYLAGTMLEVKNLKNLPRMIKSIDMDAIKDFFVNRANHLLDLIKPE